MVLIARGTGTTDSERYLASLAEHTFLNLWSYPNAFTDRGAGTSKDGKELCDLLVVCGDNIILFSDKSIAWPVHGTTELRWSRWYRRAVEHSVKQLLGAARWLREYPDRVFTDAKCSTRLVASLPPSGRGHIHLIAIALGAQAACSKHHRDDDGSLMIASNIAGAAHTDSSHPSYNPFCLGDVNPEGNFIHVFDETSLNLVMREMDTIADFVRYLEQRENAIRERRVHMAVSEAEMLAYYLSHEDSAGNHHFPLRRGDSGEMMPVSLIAGSYSAYRGSAACKAKTAADRLSYAWDRLITVFSDNVLGGTSVTLDGSDPSPQHAEQALRGMALECRTTRRALADGFIGAMREAERHAQDRFARVILPQKATADPECGYVFLIMAFKARWMVKLGYARYREVRTRDAPHLW